MSSLHFVNKTLIDNINTDELAAYRWFYEVLSATGISEILDYRVVCYAEPLNQCQSILYTRWFNAVIRIHETAIGALYCDSEKNRLRTIQEISSIYRQIRILSLLETVIDW